MTVTLLALHGYHGSARVLRRQLTPLAAVLPQAVEITYLDAPSLARGDFGWWHEGFSGWERTRDWLLDLAGTERFDGVLGFSQGAALTGLLAAVQHSAPGSTPLSFRFAVMIGGFTSDAPQHAPLLRRPLTMPSLHVTGSSDAIVPMRDSLRLAARFVDPVIVEHPGGHVVPHDPAAVARIAEFVRRHAPAGQPAGQ